MTDQYGVPELPEEEPTPQPEPEAPAEHDDQSVLEGAGDFTSGEGLVAFAGMVVLAVWIIFDLIVDNYNMDNVIAIIASLAIILPRLDRDKVERFHSLPVLMKVIGWALALFGLMEFIVEVRFAAFDDFGIVIAALIAYAGYVMAFVGARQIEIQVRT